MSLDKAAWKRIAKRELLNLAAALAVGTSVLRLVDGIDNYRKAKKSLV